MIDFDGLYALHARTVFRSALSLSSGNRAMAENIASETFVAFGVRATASTPPPSSAT